MPCTAACPGCNQQVNIPDELLGKQIRCSSCQTVFIVQAPQPAPGLSDFASMPLPQASFSSALPRQSEEIAWRPSHQSGFQGSNYGSSPAPKRRAESRASNSDEEESTSALAQFGILLIVVGIVGMILPLFGYELVRLRRLGPVGGGFIGLAGCVFVAIGYFMNNKPLHAILGSFLPSLVLITGIAGWLSVNSQADEEQFEQASAPEQQTSFRDQVRTPHFPSPPTSNLPRPGLPHEQHLSNSPTNPSTGFQSNPNSLGITADPHDIQKFHQGLSNPISIPQPPSGFGPNGPNRTRMNPGEAFRPPDFGPPDFGPPPSGFSPSSGNMGPPRISPPNFSPPNFSPPQVKMPFPR